MVVGVVVVLGPVVVVVVVVAWYLPITMATDAPFFAWAPAFGLWETTVPFSV